LWQSVHRSQRNYKYAELCQINEKNDAMQREMAAFGVEFDKRHRIYAKTIA